MVGVVTQPDRPKGRGRALQPPVIKILAEQEMLPVLQPERPVGEAFSAEVRALDPEVSIVVAYGQILRPEILDLPAQGSINVHASLLPALRGAAPIQWAIANGDAETGVTVMRMAPKMDAGPILLQASEPIGEGETGSDLTARLSEIGAEALIEALALLEAGLLTETEQDHERATFAPRITREDARVDWAADADVVARRVRAFDSVPGAWTTLDGATLKVFRPLVQEDAPRSVAAPGTVLEADAHNPADGLRVACGRGAVYLREVQPAGRRRMTAAAWLRGHGIEPGTRLG